GERFMRLFRREGSQLLRECRSRRVRRAAIRMDAPEQCDVRFEFASDFRTHQRSKGRGSSGEWLRGNGATRVDEIGEGGHAEELLGRPRAKDKRRPRSE